MKYKLLIGLVAAIFLLGIAGSMAVLLSRPSDKAEIVSDGVVVRTVDLSSAPDEVFEIEYEGRTNTVEISGGRIRVKDAECPDHTCMHMGWLKGSGTPIVCLPNHLVIRFAETDVDAVAG